MMLPPGGPAPSINLPGGSGGEASEPPAEESAEQSALQKAASALQQALQIEKDPQDKAMIAKLLQGVHSIEASRAKEADAAMGISPPMKFIRRQAQGQGA